MFSTIEAAWRRSRKADGGLETARVLDLYAGSGALGIEALSRGASRAVFVELARPALASLGENLRQLGLDAQATVLAAALERNLDRIVALGPFDLVLVDPPYADVADGKVARILATLLERGLLTDRALLVLEHASRDEAPSLPGVVEERSRRYGDTSVSLYVTSAAARDEGAAEDAGTAADDDATDDDASADDGSATSDA